MKTYLSDVINGQRVRIFPKQIRSKVVWGLFIILLTMTGCGGGGGDGSSSPTDSPPIAQFTVSADTGSYPLSVTFDASGSTGGSGTITQYQWRFGDGITGSGPIITHVYAEVGTFTAQLTITGTSGLTSTKTLSIEVKPRYTFSGTVTSGNHVVVDSDLNDTNSDPVSNNSINSAQPVQVPCSISGYVNLPRQGPEGNSWLRGDVNDFYRVSLTSGMNIILYMAEDPGTTALDLSLYDAHGTIVGSSLTSTGNAVVSLKAPASGTYYVRVVASESASTYVLTIGQSRIASEKNPLRLTDDFVPGESIVRFKDQTGEFVSALSAA